MLHVAIISYVLHAVHPMHMNIMQLLVLVDFSKLGNINLDPEIIQVHIQC